MIRVARGRGGEEAKEGRMPTDCSHVEGKKQGARRRRRTRPLFRLSHTHPHTHREKARERERAMATPLPRSPSTARRSTGRLRFSFLPFSSRLALLALSSSLLLCFHMVRRKASRLGPHAMAPLPPRQAATALHRRLPLPLPLLPSPAHSAPHHAEAAAALPVLLPVDPPRPAAVAAVPHLACDGGRGGQTRCDARGELGGEAPFRGPLLRLRAEQGHVHHLGPAAAPAEVPRRGPRRRVMFDCMDRPSVNRSEYCPDNGGADGSHFPPPPPLFRYCTTRDHLDIPFPDWSFWGWPEINIKPWDEEFQNIKLGSQTMKWRKRARTAYWKGNPDVQSPVREAFYKIYAEGYAWSVSLKYIVACGSLALIIEPRYEDFFSRGLVPKENYWPISPTDLCPSIKFAAEAIGKKGQAFMQELNLDQVYDYMYHLIEYSKLQRISSQLLHRRLKRSAWSPFFALQTSSKESCSRDHMLRLLRPLCHALFFHPASLRDCESSRQLDMY
ncbi:hypothetical protein MUK42_11134, partial [Musa troglodytarum]